MAEPLRDLEPALDKIAERWDAPRTERTLAALKQKRVRRRRLRTGLATGCAVGLLAVLGLFILPVGGVHPATTTRTAQSAPTALHMRLVDGSEVLLRDEHTRVNVSAASPDLMALDLVSGRARFEVEHRTRGVFRVSCGEVEVEVLGTSFEVEREQGRAHVVVLRGRVAVTWRGGRTELAAGEAGWFPRAERTPDALPAPVEAPSRSKPSLRRSSAAAGSWREPAEQGDFERAYELLAQSKRPIPDDVEELLLAADTARLSGHPAAALPYLQRVVSQHAGDSRASLAAFTLGGVLMQQLGQPREAEAAYARARALSLNSSLAEDALARQVEAAHRAGDTAHARTLATEYMARYPEGRRVRAVQRFGKLSPP